MKETEEIDQAAWRLFVDSEDYEVFEQVASEIINGEFADDDHQPGEVLLAFMRSCFRSGFAAGRMHDSRQV